MFPKTVLTFLVIGALSVNALTVPIARSPAPEPECEFPIVLLTLYIITTQHSSPSIALSQWGRDIEPFHELETRVPHRNDGLATGASEPNAPGRGKREPSRSGKSQPNDTTEPNGPKNMKGKREPSRSGNGPTTDASEPNGRNNRKGKREPSRSGGNNPNDTT